jgi:hypothetical protein
MDTIMSAAGWLLWPIGVSFLVLLVQLIMLAYGALDCLTIMRYELLPVMKDIRLTAAHVEDLSGRMVTGTDLIKQGVTSGRHGVQALIAGLKKSFNR